MINKTNIWVNLTKNENQNYFDFEFETKSLKTGRRNEVFRKTLKRIIMKNRYKIISRQSFDYHYMHNKTIE
jgi:hypothetical protein